MVQRGRKSKAGESEGTSAGPGQGRKPARKKRAVASQGMRQRKARVSISKEGRAKPQGGRARVGTKPRRSASAPLQSRALPSPPTEEERIESAKYLAGPPQARVFEEERFIFPESYGGHRVRLLVRDPEWLFAYWDVDWASLEDVRREAGERGMALSRLTLRITDPGNGGMSVLLLTHGTRSCYVKADSRRRAYRAQLGLTLPSGEFRFLAESNTVLTPRVGPSKEKPSRRMTYGQAGEIPLEIASSIARAELKSVSAGPGPWQGAQLQDLSEDPKASAGPKGGASDVFRPAEGPKGGASDVHRR